MKKLLIYATLTFSSIILFAQTGKLTGKVTDKETGEELIGATILIKGTTTGTITDFSGNYTLNNLTTGNHTIQCSYVSYENIDIDIDIKDGEEKVINFILEPANVSITEVAVVAKKNRESENLLLLEQKNAVVAVENIGARELSVKGVSDAASAATKITGVTKQEGAKTLNVRGLGDRYNTTLLNGLPLPSNNAETKNIDLELFGTDLIEYVGVEKVFTSPMYGDFAGATINISSKKFSGNPFIQVGIKSGVNTSVFDTDQFYLQDGPGISGFDNFKQISSLNTYDFETTWNPVKENVNPNLGFSISGGKSFEYTSSKLNTFFTISYDNEYGYTDLIQNRVNGSDLPRKTLEGEQFNFETQTTGMLNLNYERGNNQFYLNTMLINSSDQELKNLRGKIMDLANVGAYVRRSDFERTRVLANQLLGNHELNETTNLNWGVSYNNIVNIIPDRRHITLSNDENEIVNETRKHFTNDNESDNFRYFHDFIENEYAGNISVNKTFGSGFDNTEYKAKLTVGYSGKYKKRDFESTQFNHDLYRNRDLVRGIHPPDGYYIYVDMMDIDAFLNNENLERDDNFGFYLKTFFGNVIRPSTYNGTQIVNGGFTSLEYHISQKLLAFAGLRVENVYQKVEYTTSLEPEGDFKDFSEPKVLPSLSFKYTLNNTNNLRLAFGKTYTLPQFTEMALFLFEGITDATLGNPYLYPSDVYNLDLKWEYFPKSGELISVTPFGKYIADPINKFVMASASNDFTFANTGDWATILGLEVEVKKDIISAVTESGSKKIFATANLTLMETNQELNAKKVKDETEGLVNINFNTAEDGLQGAAPLIANANLGYKTDWNNRKNSFTASLVYNYVSDRIFLIGTSSFGNQVDKEVHTIDFVMKSRLNRVGISFSAKNILNPDINRFQENESKDFIVKSYKKGIKASLGITYKF